MSVCLFVPVCLFVLVCLSFVLSFFLSPSGVLPWRSLCVGVVSPFLCLLLSFWCVAGVAGVAGVSLALLVWLVCLC